MQVSVQVQEEVIYPGMDNNGSKPADSLSEKRKFPRVKFICPLLIMDRMRNYIGSIRNISMGGLAFESVDNMLSGKVYVFEFLLPNKKILDIKGEVKWSTRFDITTIYGVQFRSMGFFTRIKLNTFIKESLEAGKKIL